ncbi:transformation/transcription domain-associated protein-like [Uloborus diversus]|uniref:transformation/transcription domain-associated protein-like n=1 Tax=Uloborus diversus TaxID=327109 RepID=UPI0024098134|nr:transformation/transcription domain-associated protein-like [Uloborus diversus]
MGFCVFLVYDLLITIAQVLHRLNDSKNCDVHSTICKVDQYISMLSDLSKMKKRQFYLHDKTKYLCSLHYERQDLKMFAKSPLERYETVHIARFLPQVKLAQKGNTIARKLSIEGDNGKIYQYSLTFNQESGENRKIDRISNLQQVMNCLFPKIKNMAKKRLKFKIREAIFLNPHTCLMYEGDSAVSLFDIFEEHCSNKGIKSSAPLHKYYKSIQGLHEAGVINSEVLKRIFTSIQSELVPQNLLKDWVHHAHPCAADYWKFRTQFTHHAALLGMIEHVIGLSPQTPDFMYIQRSSGEMNFLNFRFSLIHEDAGTETERKVPFRLTSNICKFITPYGVWGTFGGTLLNAVECLRIQWWKIESVIKVLLMDELLSLNQKKASKSEIACNKPEFFISTIERSVCETYERIEPLSGSEKEHHVQLWKLISSAESCDNLSALDPFSYPWL